MNNKTYRTLILVISSVIILAAVLTVYYLSRQTINLDSSPISPANPSQQTNNGSSFPTSPDIERPETTANSTDQNNLPEINPTDQITTDKETFFGEIKNTSDTATGGMTFIEKNRNGTMTTFIRYIEKGTGHIKEIAFDENIPTKITNTTITGVFSSSWNKDGASVLIRRLNGVNNEIQTIYGTIEAGSSTSTIPEGAVGKLNGTILPANTLDVIASPQGDKLFYLIQNGDSVVGATSEFKGTRPFDKKITIWSSPISEWKILWPKQDQLMLLTKPAYNIPGLLYSLSVPRDNKFEKVLGDIIGLTAIVSNSGNKIIYSETTGSGFMTYLLDKQSGELRVLPVKTLPEKCVWSKTNENIVYCGVPKNIIGAKYPDSWYKGTISFNDNIHRIDLDTNSSRRIEILGQPGELDSTDLILNQNEEFLALINKTDSKIWTIKIR